MRLYFLLVVFVVVLSSCRDKSPSEHQHEAKSTDTIPVDTLRKSIPKEVHAQVGKAHVMIHYHAPAVRGRMIWGGLVPYGEVWVTGAHSATTFEISSPVRINSTDIAAGKYALFTIPGKEKWIIILNKNWEQHLADEYTPELDVVRIEVVADTTSAMQERLLYNVESPGGNSGEVIIRWEKVRVVMPFEVL